MILIFLGPPGAGKGTQAKRLEEARGMVQLSTGEILRAAVAAGSPVGKDVKQAMDRGELVGDTVVVSIIEERIENADCQKGFILDGFPRTLAQAKALDHMLDEKNLKLNRVIEIHMDDKVLTERIIGRFSCVSCGEGYHDRYRRPKVDGVCDACGGTKFDRRNDDNAETVSARLGAYHAETAPLLPYYRDRGVLSEVNGMTDVDDVTRQINDIVDAS